MMSNKIIIAILRLNSLTVEQVCDCLYDNFNSCFTESQQLQSITTRLGGSCVRHATRIIEDFNFILGHWRPERP